MGTLPIPIVDIFAGPGGLGEGFCSLVDSENNRLYYNALSIEHDVDSHKTLLLRHFYRSFTLGHEPDAYFDFLAGDKEIEEIFRLYPMNYSSAAESARRITLGPSNRKLVRSLISKRLHGVEHWILVGGPPCQAYSLAGRSRMKSNPDFESDHRHFLYREYLEILADHAPPVFVMENVKGLLSATVGGVSTINMIVDDLRHPQTALKREKHNVTYRLYSFVTGEEVTCGVNPNSFLVRAEDYGVPQARHRLLILGIRQDINAIPGKLKPSKSRIAVSRVIEDLPAVRSGLTRTTNDTESWRTALSRFPIDTVKKQIQNSEKSSNLIANISTILNHLSDLPSYQVGNRYTRRRAKSAIMKWLRNNRMKTISLQQARNHMESDLHRYLYASAFAQTNSRSPKLSDFPQILLPNHKNILVGHEDKAFADRFRVQLPDRVATTITSHISKDGHYYIHHDPRQCRSLTVREAARLQTFPDDYYFIGSMTSKYHQIGNAVPPYLAQKLADVVYQLTQRAMETK